MIVCVCRRVSDQQIRQAAADGAHSLECLQFDAREARHAEAHTIAFSRPLQPQMA